MAAPLDSVPFAIGGRDLSLRYGLGALAEAQREMGLDDFKAVLARFDEVVGAAARDASAVDLRVLNPVLWAGLLESWEAAEGRRPAVAEVAGLLTIADLRRALVAVSRAFVLSMSGPPREPAKAEGGAGDDGPGPPRPPAPPDPASSPPGPSSGSGSPPATPTA